MRFSPMIPVTGLYAFPLRMNHVFWLFQVKSAKQLTQPQQFNLSTTHHGGGPRVHQMTTRSSAQPAPPGEEPIENTC